MNDLPLPDVIVDFPKAEQIPDPHQKKTASPRVRKSHGGSRNRA